MFICYLHSDRDDVDVDIWYKRRRGMQNKVVDDQDRKKRGKEDESDLLSSIQVFDSRSESMSS